jgi:hypothetical protein
MQTMQNVLSLCLVMSDSCGGMDFSVALFNEHGTQNVGFHVARREPHPHASIQRFRVISFFFGSVQEIMHVWLHLEVGI